MIDGPSISKAHLGAGSVYPAKERRAATRYRIEGSVRFTWLTEAGRRLVGTGHTRDISVAGAFVESPTIPPLNAAVVVSAAFLSGPHEGLRTTLVGAGTVCRIETRKDGETGFAVAAAFRTGAAV